MKRNDYTDPVDGPQHVERPDDYESVAWRPGDPPDELAALIARSKTVPEGVTPSR